MDWQVQIDLRREAADAVLEVEGDLDLDTCEALRSMLQTASSEDCDRVIVDVSEVRHTDSSGIRVMAQVARELREQDRDLLVRGAPYRLARTLAVLGLSHLLEGSGAPDAAIA